MRRLIIAVATTLFISCGSTKIVQTKDITSQATWLDSSEHNPIVNVIQKQYANDDIEIVIKKKLTTDYIKIMLRKSKRIINKQTIINEEVRR
jgi:hypothetical protein